MMGEQAYFPLFVSMEGKKILVVGGGRIAARRVKVLLDFTRDILVIAPRLEESLQKLEEEGVLQVAKRTFVKEDVKGAYIVIAATNHQEMNNYICEVCKEHGILVNHAGDQKKCDFFFPGIIKDEALVIGVTASGANHGLVKKVTNRIRQYIKMEEKDNDS